MFTGITTHASYPVTAFVVLTGAAILGGGAASADSNQDDQFLALLSQQGIPALSGVPDLIKTAHDVCGELNSGVPTDAVVAEFEDFANSVTPGRDPGRVHRSAIRFVTASAGAYCPNHQVGFTKRNGSRYRVELTSFVEGVTNPIPPLPSIADAQTLNPPPAAAPAAPKKAPQKAPPVVGPPSGSSEGGGGNGGGDGGAAPTPPPEPGRITLAP
jgi:Protein of unknown function (DUF732)